VTDAEQILEARARALAEPIPAPPDLGEQVELLAFAMDGERCAVEARQVLEVMPLRPPTPVPSTPPFLLGLVNHRGRVLPVYDLAAALGTGGGGPHATLVAVEVAGLRFGIAAQDVEGVTSCELARLGDPVSFVRRVAGEPLAVLDLEGLAEDGRLELDDRNGDHGGQET
jgi:purine-binding chemotaxis protein CheW